ncbi:MAG: DMT family transporter [Limnohabitans sp.]|nr:DMT family transporter [Limnohabitans sp.]
MSTSAPTKSMAGIGLLLMAVACFAFIDTLTKQVTLTIPILMVVWVRYSIQAILTTAYIFPKLDKSVLSTHFLRIHLVCDLLMLMCTLLAIVSLKHLPVGEFSAIVMTSPLVVTLLAQRLLGEHVSVKRVMLVIGGFIGVLLIVRPGSDAFSVYMFFQMVLVVLNAAFQLLTSKLSQTEKSMTIHFYSVWTGALLTSFLLFWGWTTITQPLIWFELLLIGAVGAIGHFCLIVAFQKTEVVVLMPYMYAQIGFAMLGGWLMFNHIPDR